MIDIEQASLRRLEDEPLVRGQRVVQESAGVADERADALRVAVVFVRDGVRVERLARGGAGGERGHQLVLERHHEPQAVAEVVRAQEFAHADGEPAADLVLVARPDPAAGSAELPLAAAFEQPLLFHVIREDDVRVVAQEQRAGHVDAARGELIDLFEEPRRVHHHAVADDARDVRPDDAGGEERELERLPVDDDGVPGVGPAVVPDDEIEPVAEKIDDLPFGLVAPLQPDHARTRHCVGPPQIVRCESTRLTLARVVRGVKGGETIA